MLILNWKEINELCKEHFKVNQDFNFLYECKYGLVVSWRYKGIEVRELLENETIKNYLAN